MSTIDRAEFEQLILQIEQDLLLQAQHFGALLVAKDPTIAGHHRGQLRLVTARIKHSERLNTARPPRQAHISAGHPTTSAVDDHGASFEGL